MYKALKPGSKEPGFFLLIFLWPFPLKHFRKIPSISVGFHLALLFSHFIFDLSLAK
jgi:hypothetical protein